MTPDSPSPDSILLVCLGNICRSPLAEGVLRHLAAERGLGDRLRIDSAGTGGWHVGEPPDRRARAVAERHGIRLTGSARRVGTDDFSEFRLVLAMDRSNLRDLEALRDRSGGNGELRLLREFDPEADGDDLDVPDPYYGGPEGFERVFRMILRSAEGVLDALEDGDG
jgi:protein-tyrosine phosphatase